MSEELNLNGMVSSGRRDIKRFKVTDGSHIFRILPPFGTNHNNVPSREIQLHWGFAKKDGKTSPVPCSYPHEQYCPICEFVKAEEARAEREKALGNTEKAKEILEAASQFKAKRSFLLNASNKAGEIGILEIPKTALEAAKDLFQQYQNRYNKNPVSLTTGVWLVFSRTGKGFNTTYSVEFNKTILTLPDGDQVEKLDTSPLAANIVENYQKLAYDIHKMYPPVASSDLKKILGGAPIDEVIVRKQKSDEEAPSEPVAEAPKPVAAAKAPPAAKPVAKAPAKAAAKPEPAPELELDQETSELMDLLNDE
jgi:hypothetical protein